CRPQKTYFRAGYLQYANTVFVTKANNWPVDRRKDCSAGISRILIDNAFNYSDEAVASSVASPCKANSLE
ncbi:MAG: hypothetical protein PHH11_15820, partial [Methylomonas sp.]|nr:hypothetical protein [Methylomonas sp.]